MSAQPHDSQPLEEIGDLDRTIHEPTRLAILTVLASCASADFLFLQRATGVTKGNLSSHLTKLEEAGLVEIEKRFVEKRPNTLVRLTEAGRTGVEEHWARLDGLRNGARSIGRQA
jgi:DNA-binding transcriptional ArsR family regulator